MIRFKTVRWPIQVPEMKWREFQKRTNYHFWSMTRYQSEAAYMTMIQRELALLNQKVSKLGKINTFLLQKRKEKQYDGRLETNGMGPSMEIELTSLSTLLLILYVRLK